MITKTISTASTRILLRRCRYSRSAGTHEHRPLRTLMRRILPPVVSDNRPDDLVMLRNEPRYEPHAGSCTNPDAYRCRLSFEHDQDSISQCSAGRFRHNL